MLLGKWWPFCLGLDVLKYYRYIISDCILTALYCTCFSVTEPSGLILGLRQADKRRRYKVTPSLIGWAQT